MGRACAPGRPHGAWSLPSHATPAAPRPQGGQGQHKKHRKRSSADVASDVADAATVITSLQDAFKGEPKGEHLHKRMLLKVRAPPWHEPSRPPGQAIA